MNGTLKTLSGMIVLFNYGSRYNCKTTAKIVNSDKKTVLSVTINKSKTDDDSKPQARRYAFQKLMTKAKEEQILTREERTALYATFRSFSKIKRVWPKG